MKEVLTRLRDELGALGIASLATLTGSLVFYALAVRPLEDRVGRLDRTIERAAARPAADAVVRIRSAEPQAHLDDFYRFFRRTESTDMWLAKLYGIATAAGLELRAGDYRLSETRYRIERYQVTLPVSGTYASVRTFVETALAEIPVLSLDQVTFRRKAANDHRIEAEVVLTMHLHRP